MSSFHHDAATRRAQYSAVRAFVEADERPQTETEQFSQPWSTSQNSRPRPQGGASEAWDNTDDFGPSQYWGVRNPQSYGTPSGGFSASPRPVAAQESALSSPYTQGVSMELGEHNPQPTPAPVPAPMVGAGAGLWANRTRKQKYTIGVVVALVLLGSGGAAAAAILTKSHGSPQAPATPTSTSTTAPVATSTAASGPATPTAGHGLVPGIYLGERSCDTSDICNFITGVSQNNLQLNFTVEKNGDGSWNIENTADASAHYFKATNLQPNANNQFYFEDFTAPGNGGLCTLTTAAWDTLIPGANGALSGYQDNVMQAITACTSSAGTLNPGSTCNQTCTITARLVQG